jgi:N-acetyl-anhydromuramyl-L-alanine amidase AmpD
MALTIVRKPTPNFRRGRGRHKPIAIVIHITSGLNNKGGVDAHFNNPDSGVSAHYMVQKDGVIHQYVDEKDTAIHAGIVVRSRWPLINTGSSPNSFTIGIEHEGRDGDSLTPKQQAASVELIQKICARQAIPIDALHIIPHNKIRANKTCPGSGVDVATLIRLANAPTP